MTRLRPLRALAALAVAAWVLNGCASHPAHPRLEIDDSITAVSQDSRVRYIVLHYTSTNGPHSLELLSQGVVSTHYLVTDDPRPRVYRLVDENRSAWHAGASSWYAQVSLNPVSIGIELVNAGRRDQAGGATGWQPYPEAQVQVLILLLRDLIARHGVHPENIVAHSDIAPQRKTDPGPLFPWKRLADAGIGRWYDEAQAAAHWVTLQRQGLPDVAWFQQQLARLGYASPRHGRLDRATRNVLAAFQMHYRAANYDGKPDAETA
ncbi:MAG TPA: N-acetylmuramoyl-L-alanine amidase, partial [Bordetella sp.]|nr:N-acetylmuramoyl-L-alanine amidase [Bordetella sp.]